MTYSSLEISNDSGKPVGLYKFQWGNTIWRYTSADRDITGVSEGGVETFTYTSVAISDNGVAQGGGQESDFTVRMQSDLPLPVLFRGTPPSGEILLTCRHKHADDDDAPVFWTGTVGNVKTLDDVSASVVCRTLGASLKRTGLRLAWGRPCPHALYDRGCRVDPALFAVPGVVTAKDGTTITVSGAAAATPGIYLGGFVTWEVNGDGTLERRGIEATADGGVFTLYGRADRIEVGYDVTMNRGCDHTSLVCETDFDNLANNGGFDFLPNKSPFDGTPVF